MEVLYIVYRYDSSVTESVEIGKCTSLKMVEKVIARESKSWPSCKYYYSSQFILKFNLEKDG
jgi:hypothetical protein